MVKTLREWEKALSQAVDTDYSYGLARRMEGYNPMPRWATEPRVPGRNGKPGK